MKNYWLVKQEPETYPWAQFVTEQGTSWTGVRNFQARNHLRAMKKGDAVLYYHSGKERAVVGECRVGREAYPDTTAEDGDWSTVDLIPERALQRPVSLAEIKGNQKLQTIALVRQSRLSVMPLQKAEYEEILQMAVIKK